MIALPALSCRFWQATRICVRQRVCTDFSGGQVSGPHDSCVVLAKGTFTYVDLSVSRSVVEMLRSFQMSGHLSKLSSLQRTPFFHSVHIKKSYRILTAVVYFNALHCRSPVDSVETKILDLDPLHQRTCRLSFDRNLRKYVLQVL